MELNHHEAHQCQLKSLWLGEIPRGLQEYKSSSLDYLTSLIPVCWCGNDVFVLLLPAVIRNMIIFKDHLVIRVLECVRKVMVIIMVILICRA
jgi:hypothetical protein